jgi:hypothetical protein
MSNESKDVLKGDICSMPNIKSTKYATKEDVAKISESIEKLRGEFEEIKLMLSLSSCIEAAEARRGEEAKKRSEMLNAAMIDARIRHVMYEDLQDGVGRSLISSGDIVDIAKKEVERDLLPLYDAKIRQVQQAISDILAILELSEVEKKYPDFNKYRAETQELLKKAYFHFTIEDAYLLAKMLKDEQIEGTGAEGIA